VCVAAINASKYAALKSDCHRILREYGWDMQYEFKGAHLFSLKNGDSTVEPETRIAIANELLANSTGPKNARMRFRYAVTKVEPSDSGAALCKIVPRLVKKVLKPAQKSGGKNLVAVSLDYRNDVHTADVREPLRRALDEAGYVLFEDVLLVHSGVETVGILYADLVAYLAARIDIYGSDPKLAREQPELFPLNHKHRKLLAAQRLLEQVKAMKQEEIDL
jgi:hypothetical protein